MQQIMPKIPASTANTVDGMWPAKDLPCHDVTLATGGRMSESATRTKPAVPILLAVLWAVAIISWPALAGISALTGGQLAEPLHVGSLTFETLNSIGAILFLVAVPIALAATVAWLLWRGELKTTVGGNALRVLAVAAAAFGGYLAAMLFTFLLYPLFG